MTRTERWEQRPGYLMSAVGAHMQIRFHQLLAPLGLTPQHFGVLRGLSVHEGATQQEMADALRYRRAAMVGLVDELEAKGFVERRRHPSDRRANALHLTAAGRRVITKVSTASAVVEEELLAPLEGEARAHFLAGLHQVAVVAGVADGIFPMAVDDDGHATPAANEASGLRTERRA